MNIDIDDRQQLAALALALREVETASVVRSPRQVDHYSVRTVDSGMVSAVSLEALAAAYDAMGEATTIASLRASAMSAVDALAAIVLGRSKWEAAKAKGVAG